MDDGIGVVKTQLAHIGNGLDLKRALLVLVIRHVDAELLASALDSIPAGQAAREVNIAGETEVSGVENLIGSGIFEN